MNAIHFDSLKPNNGGHSTDFSYIWLAYLANESHLSRERKFPSRRFKYELHLHVCSLVGWLGAPRVCVNITYYMSRFIVAYGL